MATGFRISEFPNDDQYWRVDWIGKVAHNPHVDSEPKVHILLSALHDNYRDPLKNTSRTSKCYDEAWIGVGQLPLVSVGSVWRRRKLHSVINDGNTGGRLETFTIAPTNLLRNTFAGNVEANGRLVRCMPKAYYEVGGNFKHLANTPLWVYPVERQSFKFVLIPPAELLRTYYLCSSDVARAVFSNDIGALIDLDESAPLEDGSLFLMLWKNIADGDAWFIGRWYASKETGREIDHLHRAMMTASVNAPINGKGTSHAVPIEIGFPFDDETTLTAYGKRLRIATATPGTNEKDVWAFLVLGIRTCSHPLLYVDLAVDRKNNAAKGANSEDPDLPATAFPPATTQPQQVPPEDELNLISNEEPQKDVRPLLLQLFKDRFVDLLGRALIQDEKSLQKYKSAKGKLKEPQKFETHGTGEGDGTSGDAGKVDIQQQTNPFKTRLPADLKTFLDVVKTIRSSKDAEGWKVTTLTVSDRGWPMDADDVLACFPARIKGCRSWHLMSLSPERPRAIVIARIDEPRGTSYVMELERKTDKHCVLVLRADDGLPLVDATLERSLVMTARKNGWPPSALLPRLLREKVTGETTK